MVGASRRTMFAVVGCGAAALGGEPSVQVCHVIGNASAEFKKDRAAAEDAEFVECANREANVAGCGPHGKATIFGVHGATPA